MRVRDTAIVGVQTAKRRVYKDGRQETGRKDGKKQKKEEEQRRGAKSRPTDRRLSSRTAQSQSVPSERLSIGADLASAKVHAEG